MKALVFFVTLLAVCPLQADWLHYRGPTENGVAKGKAPTATPRVLWKAQLGKGTSSVTTQGGLVYTMGNPGEKDVIYCLDAASGAVVWRHEYPMSLDPNLFEGGPRSTPVIDGDRLYAVSHQGDLWCLDAKTGKKIWYRHFQQELEGRRPGWGYAGSPFISGSLLLCDVGAPNGSTVALDKATGKVVWKGGDDEAGYASPLVLTLDGKPTVVTFKAEALVGQDLKDGHELWRTRWKTDYDINAATPLPVGDDRLLITSAYNAGCALVQIRNGQVKELWRNKNLRAHISSPTIVGDSVFGIDGNVGGGNLVCLSLADGNRRWQEKSVKGGALIAAGSNLIVFTERGELVVCEASSAGFKPLLRAPELTKRCWTQPVLDGGHLYLRSNEGELVCLEAAN